MTGTNSQTASALALASGIVAIVSAVLMGGFFTAIATPAMFDWGWSGMWGAPLAGIFAVFGLMWVLGGVAIGIVLLAASPKLKSADAAERRTWATWTIVAGALGLVLSMGGMFVAGLGITAGVLTLMDLNRPNPS